VRVVVLTIRDDVVTTMATTVTTMTQFAKV
jgi:hypothetical protein